LATLSVGANKVRNAARVDGKEIGGDGTKTKVIVPLRAAGSLSYESIPTRTVLLLEYDTERSSEDAADGLNPLQTLRNIERNRRRS